MKTIFALLILTLLVSGCAGPTPIPAVAEAIQSDIPRETAPEISPAELATLVEGNTAFAVDLYQLLREEDGNLFFSPHSISVALAMTYAGARETTAEEMAQTLHFLLSEEELHRAFNTLDLLLAAEPDQDPEAFVLHIANSLWAEREYTFRQEFLDTLGQHYGAGLRLVDFKTAYDAARLLINAWVEEQTESRIQDLIPEGGVDALTRLVLVNAIYFNAKWVHQFPEALTEAGTFTTLQGAEVSVPMMRWGTPNQVPYARGDGYQAVELPYRGDQASMVLLVPDAGRFAEFEATLTGANLQRIIADMERRGVDLTMPRFEYEAEFALADALQELGMTAAFDPASADFSGMDGSQELFISGVFHKAFISVDEEGTEAAAATAVIVATTSMPQTDVELTVDRPFIYLIRDTRSGAVLFLGRVVDPS